MAKLSDFLRFNEQTNLFEFDAEGCQKQLVDEREPDTYEPMPRVVGYWVEQ